MDKRSWPWKKKISDNSSTSSNHPADQKIRRLNERLLAADDLAKQHATVAEEAVSGWEKAKAEYMSVKYQLDTALEQKQAAEVRLFHLDGALKEGMQQLRQVREEQEQTIHEAIVKRSREWDKLRLDLEERLADVEGQLSDLENQKTLLYKTGQERAEAVAELGRVRSEAEAEIKKLQGQVQTLDKENTSLKYEIVVLNKELGIRNQERELNSRSLDLASQQHTENTKRIAKLESECQRLRALVRKKLPGPGALLQMKLEAGVDAESGDIWNKRRSSYRTPSPKAIHADLSSLPERLLALEEESELLKQALTKKNNELQTTRLLCAQKSKLSSIDGQAGVYQRSPRRASMGPEFHVTDSFLSKENTHAALSEDGNDDDQSVADSWTSSIIMEPSSFERERLTLQQQSNGHSVKAYEKLNSIDDFLEIERLVSLPSKKQGMKPIVKVGQSPSRISEQVLIKDGQLEAAMKLSPDVSKETHVLSLSGDAPFDRRTSCFQEGLPVEHCAPELTTLVWKVIRIVEDLVSKSIADLRECQPSDDANGHHDIHSKPKLQLAELEASLKSFNAAGNAYLYGKAKLDQFMADLYSVLKQLITLPKAYKPVISRMKWRPEAVQIAEQEVLSDVGSPFSLSSNSDRCDSLARKDLLVDDRLASRNVQVEKGGSQSHSRKELSGTVAMEHVVVELKREKLELENKLKEDGGKLDSLKSQLRDSEQLVVSLRARLASAELSGIVAEKSLASITAVKAQLELRLQGSQLEVGRLREKVKELELRNEQMRNRDEELQMKVEDSRALQRIDASSLHDDIEKSNKEQGIAEATEKLAECQRTILVLGQQLKDIVSTQDGGPFVTYLNQVPDDADKAESSNAKQRSSTDPETFSMSKVATDELAFSPKTAGSGLEKQAFYLTDEENPLYRNDGYMKSHKDADKQIVPYALKPASKKKLNLQSFGASAMSKSLNLEPSASPRKHANSFSKFFLRHKSPS